MNDIFKRINLKMNENENVLNLNTITQKVF